MGENGAPQGEGGKTPAPAPKPAGADTPASALKPGGGDKPAPAPKPTPPPAKQDDIGSGLEALVTALGRADTKPPSGPAPDPKVSVAFALGWQMTELYRLHDWNPPPNPDPPPASSPPPARLPAVLPGVGAMSAAQRGGLGLDQVDVELLSLGQRITNAGLAAPDTQAARAALDGGVDAGFLRQVLQLHVSLLTVLMAADFRLGKAYELGRALADLSLQPTDLRSLLHAVDRQRVAPVRAWISDLTTLLPPHAGHSVVQSLDRWVQWGENPESARFGDEDLAIRLMRRQGERWRAVLSGEKGAVDLLELQDYVAAGFGMLKRIGALALRYAIPFLPLLLLVVALVVAGVVLILDHSNSGHIAAGLGALIASAGLTWRGVGGSLGRVVGHLERPLWEAELDAAIATAIALVPGSKRIKGYKPPIRAHGQPVAGAGDASPTDARPAR